MSTPGITLYTAATPNGFKISIVLEELGLSYHAQPVNLMANEQKEEYACYDFFLLLGSEEIDMAQVVFKIQP